MAKAQGYRAAEEMALGMRCMVCETPIIGFGCRCSKELVYLRVEDQVQRWLDSLPVGIDPKVRATAVTAAASALGRQRHRAGFRYKAVVDEDGTTYPCTVDEDMKAGFQRLNGMKPAKWSPPQTRLTQRAYLEPI